MSKLKNLPPLALYIHIPWCIRKCPYCDFNSHAVRGEIPEQQYVKALLADLAAEKKAAQGREISSIFIGGGTPSLFSASAIAEILDGAQQLVPFSRDIEITMEANPGLLNASALPDSKPRVSHVCRLACKVLIASIYSCWEEFTLGMRRSKPSVPPATSALPTSISI